MLYGFYCWLDSQRCFSTRVFSLTRSTFSPNSLVTGLSLSIASFLSPAPFPVDVLPLDHLTLSNWVLMIPGSSSSWWINILDVPYIVSNSIRIKQFSSEICPSCFSSWHHHPILQSFFFFFFMATPVAYGGSHARGQIRATAAVLCHSHCNTGSESYLRPS